MKKLLTLCVLLMTSQVWASDFVFFAPNDPNVPGRVLDYRRSVNETPALQGRDDVLINPDLTGLLGVITPRYWIVSGSTVSEMTQLQKDKVDEQRIATEQDLADIEAHLVQLRQRLQDWDTFTNAQKVEVLKRVLQWLIIRERVGQ